MKSPLVQLTEDLMLFAKNPCTEIFRDAKSDGDLGEFTELIEANPSFNFTNRKLSTFAAALDRDNVEIFCEMAKQVYLLAEAAGLHEHLPKKSELAPEHNFPNKRGVVFVSKVNLPGDWLEPIDGLGEKWFYPIPEIWMKDMETFLELAKAKENKPGYSKADTAKGKNTRPARKKSGRKRDEVRDRKIHDEYITGLENNLWSSQAEYLREKHKTRWNKSERNAKSWLSALLKRVADPDGI